MPNHTELLEILFKNRGIKEEDREKFLNPSYEDHMHDPFLLKDMDKAVTRIHQAIINNEKIIVYADYDCDGIPSAVIMHDFFKKINYKNFLIYIPDRHTEGYGLHAGAVDEFINNGAKLLITFDLGITAINEVSQAVKAGIDVIIIDHHLPIRITSDKGIVYDELPKAFAIINHKQEDCDYPEDILCGAGLAFKLVQGLVKKYGKDFGISIGWEKWLLDMAGLATLSDQVPLLGENRVLAYYGLKVLQKSRRLGLAEIFHKAGVDTKSLTEEDITFTLAPRLNAASRMGDPMRAFEALATTDMLEARTLSDHLASINDERKMIVMHIMKEVKKTLDKRDGFLEKPIIVIGNSKWRVGVLGLVSAKIAEEYKKPAFVWGMEGGEVIRGSCRGIGNMNLVGLMSKLPDGSLISFGGHTSAGGFSVSHENIHSLEDLLIEAWKEEDKILDFDNIGASIDAVVSIDDVTIENYNIIDKLAPFGAGNPKPTFKFQNVQIASLKEFGKDKNHLELIFKTSKGSPVKAIAFFKNRDSYKSSARSCLAEGDKVDLIATFEKSAWGGRIELRLRIVDII